MGGDKWDDVVWNRLRYWGQIRRRLYSIDCCMMAITNWPSNIFIIFLFYLCMCLYEIKSQHKLNYEMN